VFRGLVTGWGGTTSLPNTIGPSSSRAALLEGGVIDAQAALELGLVWRLADNPVTEAAAEARRMTRLDPSRLPLWRLLKHPSFVDRFRAAVIEKS
jgi:enoyl-CoA hydratase/carnithine racemase